ncbi:MAG: GC-type dockerin domain-anchored protein [Phycisphaerales bacterium JB060]
MRMHSWKTGLFVAVSGLVLGSAAPAFGQPTCRADLDGDGRLTIFDFLEFQNAFGAGDARADWDGDGELTLFDFLAYQNDFDRGCDPLPGCRDFQVIDPLEAQYDERIELGLYNQMRVDVPAIIPLGPDFTQVQAPRSSHLPYEYFEDFQLGFCGDLGEFELQINEPGVYHLVRFGSTGTDITAVFAGVTPEVESDGDAKTGTSSTLEIHEPDLVISDKVGTHSLRWKYYQDQEGYTVEEVDDASDATTKVCDAKPVMKLIIANHGTDGQISMGDGNTRQDGKWIGKDEDGGKLGAYQTFVDALKVDGKFGNDAEICLIGCNVGDGDEGQHLVDCLAMDLGVTVRATKGTVTYTPRKDGTVEVSQSGDGWAVGTP